jgi:hypothetical protein
MGRAPGVHPYFLDDPELEWTSPTLQFSFTPPLSKAHTFLRTLLSSKDPEQWQRRLAMLSSVPIGEADIVSRW